MDPAFWRARLDYLGFDGAAYDTQGPRRIFRELLTAHAIPFLDLTAAGEEVEARRDLAARGRVRLRKQRLRTGDAGRVRSPPCSPAASMCTVERYSRRSVTVPVKPGASR